MKNWKNWRHGRLPKGKPAGHSNMKAKKTGRYDSAPLITLLFCLLYFTSYMTRKSFGAVKLGLPETLLTDAEIGYIGSALFFTYGAGQIVSGLLGDRIDPRKLILCGLAATMVCNAAFPFVTSVPLLILLWAVNGFAQALFWPPIVKLMTIYLSGDRYTRAVMAVSIAAQAALLAVYAAAALFVSFSAWQGMFALSCGFAVLTGICLVLGFRTLEHRHPGKVLAALTTKETTEAPSLSTRKPSKRLWPAVLASGLLVLIIITALVGFLRDGIEEWMSTYLYDTFSLAADLSTLMNLFMPVFGMVCVRLVAVLHLRILRNETREVALLMGICAAALLCLAIFHTLHPIFSLVMIVLAIGCIQATNTSLTCYVPARFAKSGKVSTVSGLVNAFTYVGSTIATSLIPLLFGTAGWGTTILSWGAVALCGLTLALLVAKRWKGFIQE